MCAITITPERIELDHRVLNLIYKNKKYKNTTVDCPVLLRFSVGVYRNGKKKKNSKITAACCSFTTATNFRFDSLTYTRVTIIELGDGKDRKKKNEIINVKQTREFYRLILRPFSVPISIIQPVRITRFGSGTININ